MFTFIRTTAHFSGKTDDGNLPHEHRDTTAEDKKEKLCRKVSDEAFRGISKQQVGGPAATIQNADHKNCGWLIHLIRQPDRSQKVVSESVKICKGNRMVNMGERFEGIKHK